MSERERFEALADELQSWIFSSDPSSGPVLKAIDFLREQAALTDRPEQPVEIRRTEYTPGGHPISVVDAAPVARPEPAQPLRQFGDVRYAAAVDLVRSKTETFSELWVVWGPPEKDGKRYPEYCAGWPKACHEHINDALDKELDEAKDWIVHQAFLAPQEPAQPVAHGEYTRNVLTGIADWFESRSVTAWAKRYRYSDLMRGWAHDLRSMLIAAPPSHPAPSEAGAERQERIRE